jgi:hypothetical protein
MNACGEIFGAASVSYNARSTVVGAGLIAVSTSAAAAGSISLR